MSAPSRIRASGDELRRSRLDRPAAMHLAAGEYRRFAAALAALADSDWSRPTACPGWNVRAVAGHVLGMAEMAASIREGSRQRKAALRSDTVFLDALTDLQVREHAGLTPHEIVARLQRVGPRATRGRRWTPALIRRRPMPLRQEVGGVEESWSLGYLIDTILTRDPWMHRIDISRATGRPLDLTAEHDGVLVADVVAEWAQRHGQPYRLHLTGPAGGDWSTDTQAARLELDAIDFCCILSGRGRGEGLLATEVPF
jgi:uncharacterized protein (TIGR03083 family)